MLKGTITLSSKRKYKTRTDKGSVKLNARDIQAIRWIIEQDEVSFPQLQILLTRLSTHTPKPTLLDESSVYDQIARWKKGEWIVYRNPYRDPKKPGSVYATRKALSDFGYSNLTYRVRELESLDHIFAINHVRLWLGLQMHKNGYGKTWKWHSERVLRAENPGIKNIPDARVEYGTAVANVEVELSRKGSYDDLRAHYKKTVGYVLDPPLEPIADPPKDLVEKLWYFPTPSLMLLLTGIFSDIARVEPLNKLQLEDGSTL